MAAKPKVVVKEIANSFLRAWESGDPLPVTTFAYPALKLQEGVLYFAKLADLDPLQDREVIHRCMMHLHPGFAAFVSMVLLTRHRLDDDLQHIQQFMVISTMIDPAIARTPMVQVIPAARVRLACLRLWEGQRGQELRWTWSGTVCRDDQLHWDGDHMVQRDLRRMPGITPARKLAGDRQAGGPNPSEKLLDAWRRSSGYQCREKQRIAWGLDANCFTEAWGTRLDLENNDEMMQAAAAARAMRSYAASRRIMDELGMLAMRSKTTVTQLMLDPGIGQSQAAKVKALMDRYEDLQMTYHSGSLYLPEVYLRYAKGFVPTFMHGHLSDDPLHHEAKCCSPTVLRTLGDKAGSALGRALPMIDLREPITHVCRWIGLDKPIRYADFRAEHGDWEVKFDGVDDPQIVSDEAFSGCRWNIMPQIVDYSKPLQLTDFEFASKGVVYNLARWRYAECRSNTPAERMLRSG